MLQTQDFYIQSHLAGCGAGRLHHGAKGAAAFDSGDDQWRQHACWCIDPFAVGKVFKFICVAHVYNAPIVEAGALHPARSASSSVTSPD